MLVLTARASDAPRAQAGGAGREESPCSCAGARPEILSRPFSSEAACVVVMVVARQSSRWYRAAVACPPVLHSLGAPHQAVRWRARPPVGGEQRAGAIPVALASLAGPEAEGAYGGVALR